MRTVVAAALVAGLAGCAGTLPDEDGSALPAAPGAVEAAAGPHRLRVAEARWEDSDPADGPGLLTLHLDFETGDPGVLLSGAPVRVEATVFNGRRIEPRSIRPDGAWRGDGISVFRIPTGVLEGTLNELALEISLVRVASWKEYERAGVMDGGLDEMACPPFVLRMAGEEAFWLSADLEEPFRSPDAAPPPLVEHLGHEWAATSALVTDAKGRSLKWSALSARTWGSSATLEVPRPEDAPPADPVIGYPVAVRFRVPEEWKAETVRFVFRDLPLPPAPPVR